MDIALNPAFISRTVQPYTGRGKGASRFASSTPNLHCIYLIDWSYQGKGQKDRATYIGAKTRKKLRVYLIIRGNPAYTEPLFVSAKGESRFAYSGFAQILTERE